MEARRKAGEVTYQWTGAVVELLLSRGRGVVHWPSSPYSPKLVEVEFLNSYTTREVRVAPRPSATEVRTPA